MTLEELENTLPNGLHDSEVRRIAVDYEKRELFLNVEVWVGDMGDPPERREAYKSGRITISGLIFFVMEAPDPSYPFKDRTELTIDGCDCSENLDPELLATLPSDVFFAAFGWTNGMRLSTSPPGMRGSCGRMMAQLLTARGRKLARIP